PGGPGRSADPHSVSRRVLAALEPDDRLVELVEVDGRLHVLVCGAGRVTRHRAGSAGQAHAEVEFARFTLTRLAYGMSHRDPGRLHQELVRAGALLQELLLGDAVDRLGAGDGRIVVVPPGRLHAVPWGLLPQLRDRVVAVAPSAASWLRAREVPATGGGRVVLVRGPGLASGGGEVTEVAAGAAGGPDRPVVLTDGAAGVQAVLRAIDGADLVHIAAHGTFRADSPLFSALHLDDGPLTCYDLQRLHRAPRRLVLSSCDSGLAAPAGADELLGLANALVPLGTRAVVASVVPVEDEAAVGLMTGLHGALRAGRDLAEALRDGRRQAGQLPAAVAAAASFLCLGAG
ncbi:MAG TPA: CHAT domain-containing protein, partial [Kineosporiaceae bacterium]|nr:CHAT domain-containing protein [Kineosporiaceae bacterium]